MYFKGLCLHLVSMQYTLLTANGLEHLYSKIWFLYLKSTTRGRNSTQGCYDVQEYQTLHIITYNYNLFTFLSENRINLYEFKRYVIKGKNVFMLFKICSVDK